MATFIFILAKLLLYKIDCAIPILSIWKIGVKPTEFAIKITGALHLDPFCLDY